MVVRDAFLGVSCGPAELKQKIFEIFVGDNHLGKVFVTRRVSSKEPNFSSRELGGFIIGPK
jgi:hypothetical protein